MILTMIHTMYDILGSLKLGRPLSWRAVLFLFDIDCRARTSHIGWSHLGKSHKPNIAEVGLRTRPMRVASEHSK